MIRKEEIVPIGKFQKTHALKGELNMLSDIDIDYFQQGNPMIIENDGIYVPYFAESIRKKGSVSYLVKLAGVESEEEASQFVNKTINILKEDAEDLIEVESEEHLLIGYTVIDVNEHKAIGKIVDIEDSTSNVLFIIETKEGNEIMIPANEDLIKEIDEENETITMHIPEGLLDINNNE